MQNIDSEKLAKVLLTAGIEDELVNFVEKNLAKETKSTIKNTQAGEAGAVPPLDTAPLTGGPHEALGVNHQDAVLEFVNDWSATNFNQHTSGTLADVANSDLGNLHGSNGTSYKGNL